MSGVNDHVSEGSPDARVLTGPPSVLRQYLRATLPASVAGRGDSGPSGTSPALRLEKLVPRREDVAEYGELIGGWSGDRLPLLFPHLLGFPLQVELMTAPGFPFPVLGLVHVSNVARCRHPLPLGQALDIEVRVGPFADHARGRTVDLLTEASADGEVVWTESSTYLHRESPSGTQPGPTPAPVEPDQVVEGSATMHQSAQWRLPASLGRRYAAISGDRNPIHLSPWMAKAFGFPRAIAHGMWMAAAVAAAVESRMPDSPVYTVQFRKPILLPSTVRLFTAVEPWAVRAEVRGREGSDTLHMVAAVTGGEENDRGA
jgi:acyl dehydratase